MTLTVEFFGIPRQRAGVVRCELTFDAPSVSLHDALARLTALFPALQDECIENGRLAPGYAANLDGERFVSDPEFQLSDGMELLILSADAGG